MMAGWRCRIGLHRWRPVVSRVEGGFPTWVICARCGKHSLRYYR